MLGGARTTGAALLCGLLLSACGSSEENEGGPCSAGEQQTCVCTDGTMGTQTCNADGTLGSCACGVMPMSGGSAGVVGSGGTTPIGGAGGVPPGSGGTPPVSGGAPGTGGSTMMLPGGAGTCNDEPPAGAMQAPDPPPYSGGACPTLTPGTTFNTIASSGIDRQFLLVVPENPEPGETFPVIFLWHWLNADAMSFYERADAQNAATQQRFIAVIPNGIDSIPANWPWLTTSNTERDFIFFDDMLACVSEQYPVNKNCVSSAGVSDGALWTSQLAGGRGQYLSSIIVLSGGVDINIAIGQVRPYMSPAHKMPAVVLWGGPTDVCIILQFEQASRNLEAGLTADGHFLIECIHDCGHSEPPLEPPPGQTKFGMLWDFVREHPYWLQDGGSPYNETGLPASFPDWGANGMGNAIPRGTGGTGCDGPGCAL